MVLLFMFPIILTELAIHDVYINLPEQCSHMSCTEVLALFEKHWGTLHNSNNLLPVNQYDLLYIVPLNCSAAIFKLQHILRWSITV